MRKFLVSLSVLGWTWIVASAQTIDISAGPEAVLFVRYDDGVPEAA